MQRRKWFQIGLLTWLACVFALTCGCASSWWNAFLDPTEVGNFRENVVNEIQQSISFRDAPLGVPGAVDPTPDDLVAVVEEYRIGVNDQISIRVLDFFVQNVESEFTPVVDELGYIHIPQLGYIHVQDMTARELRSELIQRARDAGIFLPDFDPPVVVSFVLQQHRTYQLSGAIATPGRYRILLPDFRLREAINQGGGLDLAVKNIYVIRDEPRPRRTIHRGPHEIGVEPPFEEFPAPPVTPAAMAEMLGSGSPPMPALTQAAGRRPDPTRVMAATEEAADPDEVAERELMEALSPAISRESEPEPQTDQPPTAPAPSPPGFIFVNDRFIESPPPARDDPGEAEPALPPAAPPFESEGVDWEEFIPDGQQRIIRIPADRLLMGDANYNIVIRNDDFIRLDAGHVGVFYLMGHVLRPGVYSLTGQQITLRQAIAAAGGLDPLAWPTRCEIVRRLDGEREEITQWNLERIMSGKDPDLFLKPEDVINVGTHAIAPLLATIRNSFRLTYGFGFVYDRNFADIDAFQPQQNPRDRRRFEQRQRFPGLFP